MSTPVLTASGLSKNFRSSRGLFKKSLQVQALENISFSLEKAKTLAIVGETGSGKTTLAHILCGLQQADSGLILMHGKQIDFTQKSQRQLLNQKIRLIFQNPGRTLNPRASIDKTLLQPLHDSDKFPPHQHHIQLIEMLQKVGLRADQADWFPNMFSVGQQQRIAIARALISEPEIVIADEPLSALDVSVQAQIVNLLLDLQQQTGVSYIFISHNMGVVKHISDQVLVMFGGEVVEYGATQDVFENPGHPYTRALLASTPGFRDKIPLSWKNTGKISTQSTSHHQGCPYARRCKDADSNCLQVKPVQQPVNNQLVSCHKAKQLSNYSANP